MIRMNERYSSSCYLAEIIDGCSLLSVGKGVTYYFKHPIVKDVFKRIASKTRLRKTSR
jgi:hypothetical protein